MKSNTYCFILLGHFFLTLLYSCSQSKDIPFEGSERLAFVIDPTLESGVMDLNQYTVDSVCSLTIPDGIDDIVNTKFIVEGGLIHIMDSRINSTIFTFDHLGRLLYKSGAKGRAKNEFLNGPSDFFVNSNGSIFAFDDNAQKVLEFKNGTFIDRIDVRKYLVDSFGMTSNGFFLYCANNKGENYPALVMCDKNNENEEILIPCKQYPYIFHPQNNQTFFSNGNRLSHVPLLSDSVFVFMDNQIEKIVKFDFKCGFLTKEHPDWPAVMPNKDPLDVDKMRKILEYKGVQSLLSYRESDDCILLEYLYQNTSKYWFYNKQTHHVVSDYGLFDGASPFCKYYLKGNQIVAYVEQENVEKMKEYYYANESKRKDFEKSSPQVKDLFDGKINTPALFYFTIK